MSLENLKQTTIVISGINMTHSGILSILNDCLFFLSKYADGKNIEIVALVPLKSMFSFPNIKFIEFPKSKKSWLFRLYYEYFYFKKLSALLKPDIWFSLHDMSPNVYAKRRFVYCHNPTPFFNPRFKDWRFGFKISLFSLFYKYLYAVNIKTNTAVIVQQHWMKKAFADLYNINYVKTAAPEIKVLKVTHSVFLDPNKIHFFYPAYPRTFKNFEVVCDAVKLLAPEIRDQIQVHLTIEKSDNAYSEYIFKKYADIPEIQFLGLLSRENVAGFYQAADVLLFPSRLETWGLPLTEFRHYNKPIFAANLPYAHETMGDYDQSYYFDAENPQQLAALISGFANGSLPEPVIQKGTSTDFPTWNALFDYIFKSD